MGFLYIIRRGDLTKIGITVDIRRRMNELKPDHICQVVKLPRERELERKLHRLFDAKRLRGSEYFSLNRFERMRACCLARRSGKRVRFPYQAPHQTRRKGVRPGVILEICGLGLATGIAAVLISQAPPKRQPPTAPVSRTTPSQSFVSV